VEMRGNSSLSSQSADSMNWRTVRQRYRSVPSIFCLWEIDLEYGIFGLEANL
jgi:hypothetical protein